MAEDDDDVSCVGAMRGVVTATRRAEEPVSGVAPALALAHTHTHAHTARPGGVENLRDPHAPSALSLHSPQLINQCVLVGTLGTLFTRFTLYTFPFPFGRLLSLVCAMNALFRLTKYKGFS